MRRHRTMLRVGLLGLLVLALSGCAILDGILAQLGLERAPDVVFLTGPDAPGLVAPGACTTFPNPVPADFPLPGTEGVWLADDGFSLDAPPAWLSVLTSRGEGATQRKLCATADAPVVNNLSIGYTYVRAGRDGSGEDVTKVFSGHLLVSTATQALAVHPTASPAIINPFDDTTLAANITGGIPPFDIAWTPTGSLDSPFNTPTVNAEPSADTTYTVRVTDATGSTVSGTVTVRVRPGPSIGSDPQRNGGWDPGVRVHLSTTVTGGTPPFTFSWSPATGLDDATRSDPSFTTPAFGTPDFGYTVMVTDAAGLQGSAVVTVHARGPLTVNPQTIPDIITPGQSSQLMANAAAPFGNLTYQWSGPGLSATDIANPIATPPATTTYTVTVTDAFGRMLTAGVTVTVRTGPDLIVTLVDSPDPAGRNVLLTYTATVANNGTASATGVVFTETVTPSMIEINSGSASQGTCTTSTHPTVNIVCDLGTIPAGASATVTLSGFTFGTGTVTSTATVTLNEVDANPANNTATATTTFIGGPN